MESRDHEFWKKVISPSLRDLVFPEVGVTMHVSGPLVEDVPLEDCGDFVWALVCLSRWAPEALLARYKIGRNLPPPPAQEALLCTSIEVDCFYDFPANSLKKLLIRLKSNLDCSPPDSTMEEAHDLALGRIQDIIIFLAEKHPLAQHWVEHYKPTETLPQAKASQRPPKKRRSNHLKLVSG